MRSFIVMAMFVASLSNAAWNGYTEDRDLEIDTQGLSTFSIVDVHGGVSVEDGSGSISVELVGDSVVIDDGSGNIIVNDVEHDLIIVNDGSGSLEATNVRGRIEQDI